MWTLCGSQNQHKQGSLWQIRSGHLFMLIHTRVGCGKKDFWFEARRKFLAHLQLNRSLPPACLSSAMLIFHGMLPHCFWELVSCACCLVSTQDTKSPLLCGWTCAFVWCWVLLRQWEALLLLPSEHPAFVMRPAVLVFIHSFQPSWNKFLLSLYLFPRQIHFFLIPPTFRSAHCCIFQVFLWSFSHILCDRNT